MGGNGWGGKGMGSMDGTGLRVEDLGKENVSRALGQLAVVAEVRRVDGGDGR